MTEQTQGQLSLEALRALPGMEAFSFELHDSLPSTNDRGRALALGGAAENTVVIAAAQTAGRGRQGRSFFSPSGTGVYMSLLLRPERLDAPERITVAAAVAAAEAIERVSGQETGIKWVNDVFLGDKKVSGILTEGGFMADGSPWAVLGVGVNLLTPEGGFPEPLRDIAGAVLSGGETHIREKLISAFLRGFLPLYHQPGESLYAAYARRDMLRGREVYITINDREQRAHCLGIAPDFGLRVRLKDGEERILRSGEARARPAGETQP